MVLKQEFSVRLRGQVQLSFNFSTIFETVDKLVFEFLFSGHSPAKRNKLYII